MRSCLTQGCMAWRWVTVKRHDGTVIPEEERLGFCGMAYLVRLP